MNANSSTVWLIVLAAFVAVGVILQYARAPDRGAEPEIKITPATYDFGDITLTKVEKTFMVTNAGGGVLEITSVSTSCGCTTAKVSNERLASGENAVLTVAIDPKSWETSQAR